MSQARAGHGTTIARELDPTGAPGIFTVIGELNGDIDWPELSRDTEEVTPHDDDIDSHVLGVIKRAALGFSINFVFDDPNHDHLTGLYYAFRQNEMCGWRLRGPGGSEDTDEWIMSGQIASISRTAPVRTGAITGNVSVQLSGPMIIDGVQIGTVV